MVPLAIAGPYRSGTSLVAGICETLGVHLGDTTGRRNVHNPMGYYESPGLAELCRRMYRQPWLEEAMPRPRRVAALASWLATALDSAGSSRVLGGKHPILSLLVDEVLEGWGERTRFIFVKRPLEEAIASLRKTNWPEWRDQPGSHEHAIRRLAEAGEHAIARLGQRCLVVEYHELLERPAAGVDTIAAFLGCAEPQAALSAATAMIQPGLYRTRRTSAEDDDAHGRPPRPPRPH